MAPPEDVQSLHKEGRLALALQAYQLGQFSSTRACADKYNVAESTLRYRLKGYPARRDAHPNNRKLTNTKESTLVQWILSIDERGLPPTRPIVRQMATLLLQKRSLQGTIGEK
jgi:hypothetical protein